MIPEEELIRATLDGDKAAFGQLVDRFKDRLYNGMLGVVGNHDEAEDVVQDTFVQAYLKLHTFQGNSKLFTWLYRIAFNNALSRQRRKRSDLSIEQSKEVAGNEPADSSDAPDEGMLRDERISLVHRAMAMLTAQHRAILVLREMEDATYEDIAAALDINIGTVRSRISRARGQLKQHLETLQKL